MASHRISGPSRQICQALRTQKPSNLSRPCFIRSVTTEATIPSDSPAQLQFEAQQGIAALETSSWQSKPPTSVPLSETRGFNPVKNPFLTNATVTTYNFPNMEPLGLVSYPGTHFLVPTRKDILHRAVVFEGDKTRQGTASTKWRDEVHGSNKKVRPQKGTGSARLGDKKSPMLKGGGVAHGPKPRDFSTGLPKKIYDLAWRTALSYRYKKGELVVVENELELDCADTSRERYLLDLLNWHKMGHAHGRTLFIAGRKRHSLFDTLKPERMGRHAKALPVHDVDVKDLLELGRLVIERQALEEILRDHQSDLVRSHHFR
ncbi:ribosomal protein L4 [Polychaeton citri CBS 116435]|uniref:Large ribosomal subunit protein uL4m n=1 Tax=Polychaeton citri CBS 116435 TaxID=1314669 RepID=A0A9P4UKC8_9PEZI|nr:ribosomal protein L4 [Polychaeton citri CBS 116435]